MRTIAGIDPGWGITAVRVAMAIIFIVAGYLKLASGVAALGGAFARMGIFMPEVAGPFIAVLELVGGLVGFAARWLGLLYAIEFTVATFYVKFAQAGFAQGRLDMMLLAGGLLLFLAGLGKAAVDEYWLEKA